MSPIESGLAGIVLLLILFFLRMPIAFAMALSGMIGFGYIVSWSTGKSPGERFLDNYIPTRLARSLCLCSWAHLLS